MFELEEMASKVGATVRELGREFNPYCYEYQVEKDGVCKVGNYSQIYQYLEDLLDAACQ